MALMNLENGICLLTRRIGAFSHTYRSVSVSPFLLYRELLCYPSAACSRLGILHDYCWIFECFGRLDRGELRTGLYPQLSTVIATLWRGNFLDRSKSFQF
jgi:hypothetical protein